MTLEAMETLAHDPTRSLLLVFLGLSFALILCGLSAMTIVLLDRSSRSTLTSNVTTSHMYGHRHRDVADRLLRGRAPNGMTRHFEAVGVRLRLDVLVGLVVMHLAEVLMIHLAMLLVIRCELLLNARSKLLLESRSELLLQVARSELLLHPKSRLLLVLLGRLLVNARNGLRLRSMSGLLLKSSSGRRMAMNRLRVGGTRLRIPSSARSRMLVSKNMMSVLIAKVRR
jgi:hypothetical protein